MSSYGCPSKPIVVSKPTNFLSSCISQIIKPGTKTKGHNTHKPMIPTEVKTTYTRIGSYNLSTYGERVPCWWKLKISVLLSPAGIERMKERKINPSSATLYHSLCPYVFFFKMGNKQYQSRMSHCLKQEVISTFLAHTIWCPIDS